MTRCRKCTSVAISVAALSCARLTMADCGCTADLNGNGVVEAADIALLLGAWATASGDINGDGVTNAPDLALLLGSWGPCPTPANDLCLTAQPIGVLQGASIPFCTANANTDGSAVPGGVDFGCPSPSGTQIYGDLWYSFTAPSVQKGISIQTCGADFDTVIALYRVEGANPCTVASSLLPVACSDDSYTACADLPVGSAIMTSLLPGKNYLLRVGGFSGTGSGVLSTDLYEPADLCGDAAFTQVFDCSPNSFCTVVKTVDTTNATDYPAIVETDCGGDGDSRDMWIRAKFSCAGGEPTVQVEVSTCNAVTNFDTVLTAFEGGCDGLVEVACNDDFSDPTCQIGTLNRKSRFTFTAIANYPYLFRVAGYNGATGTAQVKFKVDCP